MTDEPSPSQRPPRGSPRVLAAAGSFTGLWALTWLGATAATVAPAVQGGFAVGGVMAGSGLTLLWWRHHVIGQIQQAEAADAPAPTPESRKA